MTAERHAAKPQRLSAGSTVGILGGGQLGRMLALAAAKLGLRCHIYSDAPTSPAAEVSSASTVGDYADLERLAEFARNVDVVSYEFENVPVATAEHLAQFKAVYPPPRALEVAQDRLVEKTFISELGIAVAPFASVDDAAALDGAMAEVGLPAILKTRRLGYDGKGQVRLRDSEDAGGALADIGHAPAILEGHIAFEREVSVILVRGPADDGSDTIVEATYDIPLNTHRDGILDRSVVPAPLIGRDREEAVAIAAKIANALDYIGVLAVELFHLPDADGSHLVVNEIAPRVHNSGHWTMDACTVDQFENHIRAVVGWPLGATTRHSDAEMINLIGRDVDDLYLHLADRTAALHIYGKNEARDGRKMGHVNRLRPKTD